MRDSIAELMQVSNKPEHVAPIWVMSDWESRLSGVLPQTLPVLVFNGGIPGFRFVIGQQVFPHTEHELSKHIVMRDRRAVARVR